MVQWKGNIDPQEAGEKAANLESLENFDVPNFFVLTRSEVENFLDSKETERIQNSKLPDELVSRVKDAYEDIGMSSEVRTSSGRARNLVGNQRESQRVSIRISENDNLSEYKLNVGASGLEEALREVLASYFEENSQAPAVIFQKMIEPEYSGAVITNYTRRHSLVEAVEGLGHSLEEGSNVPEFYLLEDHSVKEKRVPENQVKVSRNPMDGQRRTRSISNSSQSFQDSEVEDLARKASRENLSVKFVYKRGSFYAVDAFDNDPLDVEPDLEALKVSEGEIQGRQGRDYILSEETRETDRPLVAKKGGFTSLHSQQKRSQGVPMVVSLKDEEKIQNGGSQRKDEKTHQSQSLSSSMVSGVTATEVRPLSDFASLSENPFGFSGEEKFSVSLEDVLAEEPEFVDGREISPEALQKVLETVDVRVLAVDQVPEDLLEKVVEKGLDVLAVPEDSVERVERKILRREKRFILENLRD